MNSRPAASASGGRVPALAALVPLAWAVLLLFHPDPDPSDVFGSLRDEADTMVAVHLGSLVFIGLTGAVVLLLLQDLPGPVAAVGRVAVGIFVLFYGAGEAITGVATGVLVQAGAADGAQALWDSFIADDLLVTIGWVAWVVAVVAAAVAWRQAGAPLVVSVLLALSAVTIFHAPPIGPLGLLFLAGSVVLASRSQRDLVATGTGRLHGGNA